ncbi:MAG: beta strand repeat-containing protein, partial [Bacteroidota bacterium]
ATLSVAGGVSWLWSNGGTGMSVSVSPTVTTLYQVTATDASGCTVTASATINVQNQPVLTGLSPISGTAGTQVVITGTRLTDVTGITFNGVSATGFILISDTEIRANLPVSGQVQTLGAGSPCGPATLEIRQPVITGFQPSSGPPGTLVSITGTDFQNLGSVSVNGTAVIVISSSATNITAYVMPGTQSGAITVTTATGTGVSSATFTVTPTPHPAIQQGSKLAVTGHTGTPQSGSVVAVSADGNTAVIGGPQDNSGAGAVWVFVRNGTTWSQQGTKLTGTGATGNARQGTSVAISADGNTIAAGGPADNTNVGAVWVVKRNGTTWSQQGSKLTGSGAIGTPLQGTSVSLSANGNLLASGGQGDDSYAGAAWIFSQSGGTWTQQGSKLVGTGASGKARQGAALALSADATTLLVGGYNDNSRAGAVWVFTSSSGTWSQQGDKLVGSGGTQALQGSSVAISANGNTILAGGPGDNSLAGSLWVFVRSSGIWSQQGTKLAGTSGAGSSRQGSATGLSADGNTAIWGGYGDNTNVGAYWAFKRSGATWTQQGGKITGTGAVGAARQSTGLSVSANGSTAISGGPTDASGKGAAWVFIAGAQAYTQEVDTRVIAATEEMPEFVLYQNAPNPHTGRTSVGFRLPAPCRAVWQITDASGRMVMEMTRDYPAGYNEETFELSGLSGVFEYSLTTPWGVKARKMVVVR